MWQYPYSNLGKISACLKWEKRLLPQICNDNCAAAKAACECWLLAFEKLQDWISDIVHALTKPNSAGWFRKIAKGVVDTDNNKSNAHHRNSTTATTAMALLLIAVLHFGLYIAFAIKVMCLKRHLALSSKLEVRFDKPFSKTIHLLLHFPQTDIEDMRLWCQPRILAMAYYLSGLACMTGKSNNEGRTDARTNLAILIASEHPCSRGGDDDGEVGSNGVYAFLSWK